MKIEKVCVYLASSNKSGPEFLNAAERLGELLAKHEITIVYGGSTIGPMGHLADAAIKNGGKVIGIMPTFLCDLELNHNGLSELIIVNDMHERKKKMVEGVDAIIVSCNVINVLQTIISREFLPKVTSVPCRDRAAARRS